MFKFLGFLLFIGLFGFLILGVFLGRVIRFFGPSSDRAKSNRKQSGNKTASDNANTLQKKFSKNEGEYVNYEEIKEE
jgi:predicted lipid-binding transport protein (Tim44 family)